MLDIVSSNKFKKRFFWTYSIVKKLVLAWDPDFTKVTDTEAAEIEKAEKSGYVDDDEIDWDNIGID